MTVMSGFDWKPKTLPFLVDGGSNFIDTSTPRDATARTVRQQAVNQGVAIGAQVGIGRGYACGKMY